MGKNTQHDKTTSEQLHSRWAKLLLLLCLAAVALAAVVNLFVSLLPVRYTHFDATDIELYSVSDFTRQVAAQLDQEVDIYLVSQYGKEDGAIRELLQKYSDLSPKIRTQQVDPVLRPEVVEGYASTLENNSVIVANGDRVHIIPFSAMYQNSHAYTEEQGHVYKTVFAGEQEITGAITYVTSEKPPRLYMLTGHGEAELPPYIQTALKREHIQWDGLNLAALEAVPEDADLLLLHAPNRDILDKEREMLLHYMQQGGRMMIIGGGLAAPMPNLDALAAYYGIERVEGVVAERSNSYFLENYPTYVLANLAQHDITRPMLGQGYFVLSPISQGLVPARQVRDTVHAAPLLFTTDAALSLDSQEGGETADALALGPFTLGLAVEEELEHKARLVWFTSPLLLQEDVNELSAGANHDLFMNTLSWLYDFDGGISVRTKDLMLDYLAIRPNTGMALGAVMVLLIPAAVLAVGGVVLYRRRRC